MGRRRKVGEIRSGWVSLVLFVLAALLILNVTNQLFRKDQKDAHAEGPTDPVQTETDGVRLRGWADQGKVDAGDTVGFWITIENRSGIAVSNLNFARFQYDGFQEAGSCWNNGLPVCGPGGKARRTLPVSLKPDEAVSFFAQLKPKKKAGTFVLTGVLSWSGKSQAYGHVSVGPIEVEREQPTSWLDASEAVYGFFKDLGLSIILAFLAYAFQRLQTERSRVHDTRNLFLVRASENAVKYCLPIASGMKGLLGQVAIWKAPASTPAEKAESLNRGFYYALYCLKRTRELALKGGGFFLGDIRAEQLIAHCWAQFFKQSSQYLGYREVSTALDLLEPHETLTSFERKLRPSGFFGTGGLPQPVFDGLRSGFESWLNSTECSSIQNALTLLATMLQYETNRLYSPWYQEEDSESRDEIQRLAPLIRGSLPANLQKCLDEYLSDLPKR